MRRNHSRSSADLLRNEGIGKHFAGTADDADAAGTQTHHQHERLQDVHSTHDEEAAPDVLASETVGSGQRAASPFLAGTDRF